MTVLKKTLLATALLSMTAPVFAADAEQPKSPWEGAASLSYIIKNGNSNSRAVYAKGNVAYNWTKWRVALKGEGGSTVSEDDTTGEMERTSEKYYAELREERKLTDADYLYHLTTWLNDNFSGYQYQITDSIGYGRKIFDTDTQQLSVEIGPGYSVRQREDNDPVNPSDKEEDAIVHLGVKYAWQITESTEFTEDFQADAGSDNTSIRAETGITTMLNSHLALSVAHLLTRNSDVPYDTENTDSQVTISLTYKFK